MFKYSYLHGQIMPLVPTYQSRNEKELVMLKKAIISLEEECILSASSRELPVKVDYVRDGITNVVRVTPVRPRGRIYCITYCKPALQRTAVAIGDDATRIEVAIGDYRYQLFYRSSRRAHH
mgnify:CR=1 FL=1